MKKWKTLIKVVVVFIIMLVLSFILQHFFQFGDNSVWLGGAFGGAAGYASYLIISNKESNRKD